MLRPCCVTCFIARKNVETWQEDCCIRKLIPEDSTIVFQSCAGAPMIVAQVMDAKCKYWSLGGAPSALQKHAETHSAETARLHAGNVWSSLFSPKRLSTECIVDMSLLHLMNCEDPAAQEIGTPLSLCMQTLRVTPPALMQHMIRKDINEKRRRWGRDSFVRFCS
jgi:hypothetical protein